MTWKNIADRVIRKLAGGDPSDDFPIEPEDIYMAASQIISFLAKKDFYEGYNIGEKSSIDSLFYVSFKGIPVYRDAGKYAYAVLPAKPNIIHGRGKPQVYYTKDRSWSFIYIEAGQVPILHDSELPQYSDKVRFWLENESDKTAGTTLMKIQFEEVMDKCVDKVSIRMMPLPEISCIDPNAQVPVPGHLEEELVSMLIKSFSVQDAQPQDVRPDDTKNK